WDGYGRHRVVLPTYPFARKYYWPAPAVEDRDSAATSAHSLHIPPPTNPSAAFPSNESQGETTLAAAEVAMTRKEHLLTVVTDILKELSGSPIVPADSLTTLPDLGFDSLMLTPASQLLQRKFKIPVTFRQLMGQLSTPDRLADHLDQELPAGQWEPSGVSAPAERQAVQENTPGVRPGLEEMIQQQLRITSQLLDW